MIPPEIAERVRDAKVRVLQCESQLAKLAREQQFAELELRLARYELDSLSEYVADLPPADELQLEGLS